MSPGSGFKQTYPFPLALCSPNGAIRSCTKSTFRDVVLSVLSGIEIPGSTSSSHDPFVTTCPFFTNPPSDLEMIVDFLFFLHQPPPPDICKLAAFSDYPWERIVLKLGIERGAKIVDKSQYLPPPRKILHTTRSGKTGTMGAHEFTIKADAPIPHGKTYQQLLANKDLKSSLIAYILSSFREKALSSPLPC